MLTDPADDQWNFALNRFRRPDEEVRQISGKVRNIDVRRVPIERNWLGLCVHSGNF